MKNRKFVVAAFLLAAAMLLGVGYAAISDTLDIQGTADVSEQGANNTFNDDVYFDGVMLNGEKKDAITLNEQQGYTAHIDSMDNDMAHFTISDVDANGEYKVITYVIQNDSSNEVVISLKNASTTEPTYFSYETELDNSATKTIAAGESTTVWVKVTLINDPAEAFTAAFTFGFIAAPVSQNP